MSNRIQATIKVRHDSAANWNEKNPILAYGEYGLEDSTFLLKIGNGESTWDHLPYLNKLDSTYFTKQDDGTITLSESFTNSVLQGIEFETLTISNNPNEPTDAANKRYVDEAIAAAGHLKRKKVNELPNIEDAREDTIYMILNNNGQSYDEYLFIDGEFDSLGSTSAAAYSLPVATSTALGGVRSSLEKDYIQVTQAGFMTLNGVSTSLLYVPEGDELVIYGGTA